MGDVLNLAGADTTALDPIPSDAGWLPALVFEATPTEVSSEEGKLPKGTKGLKVQFKVDGGNYNNRRVFNNYWFAPAKHESKAKMDGMLVRFLAAIGYSEDDVKSGKFELDYEDLEGRECEIRVGVRPATDQYEAQNTLRNIRPRGAGNGDGGLL